MLGAGETVREAATIANHDACIEVEKLGASTVSSDEATAAYDECNKASSSGKR